MSPGSAISAACFALISLWRFTDGDFVWAAVFAALALANLAFSLRKGSTAGVITRSSRGEAAAQTTGEEATTRRNWRIIAGTGLVLSIAALFWFPPLALVMSGLTVYSALQVRKSRDNAP